MTAIEAETTTTVLDAVLALCPEIAERAEEIESTKLVPVDLIDALTAAGAFRMFVPRQYGGEEMSLPDAMAVIEAVAKADASTGWTVMIGADFAPVFGRFPRHVLDGEIYGNGPDTMARGAFAPKGVAIRTDGGYLINGQWPLASGSYDHQWMMGSCIVLRNGAPIMTEAGVPEMVLAMVPASEAQFVQTWDSIGLRGTNSNDFVLKDVFVSDDHAGQFFGPASVDTPLFRLPVRLALGPTHVAVVMGIAEGALEDLRTLAKTKRPAFNPTMRLAADPVFQYRLGQLDIRLSSVRALAEREVSLMWDAALSREPITPLAATRQRAMVARAHTECVEIVNEAFGLAGSNAMYNTSTLQRRLRDVRTAAQHAAASAEIYTIVGALLVDEDVPPAALG